MTAPRFICSNTKKALAERGPSIHDGGSISARNDAPPALSWAICEVGKALHRGQPADGLYAAAINATQRWMAQAGLAPSGFAKLPKC